MQVLKSFTEFKAFKEYANRLKKKKRQTQKQLLQYLNKVYISYFKLHFYLETQNVTLDNSNGLGKPTKCNQKFFLDQPTDFI